MSFLAEGALATGAILSHLSRALRLNTNELQAGLMLEPDTESREAMVHKD